MNNFQHKAFSLLTSNTAQRAFQLDQESSQTCDRYGRNVYGQSLLLGRRLIEAGTRMVNRASLAAVAESLVLPGKFIDAPQGGG